MSVGSPKLRFKGKRRILRQKKLEGGSRRPTEDEAFLIVGQDPSKVMATMIKIYFCRYVII